MMATRMRSKSIKFDKSPCIYWSKLTKISHLQRRVLLYSVMYYEFDRPCVSDHDYDNISRQLVEMQNSCSKEELSETKYGYAFEDFDGSTGFDLFSKLNHEDKVWIEDLARSLIIMSEAKRW